LHHPRSQLAPEPQPIPAPLRFALNPDLDVPALARAYRSEGRVRVSGLLAEGAMALYDYLQGSRHWIHVIDRDEGPLELDPEAKAALAPEAWAAIEAAAHLRARTEFQYRYEALRVPDAAEAEADGDPLDAFARFLAGPDMLGLLRAVTGAPVTSFTDGQATAYGPGDFLTAHDDDVPGKRRVAAYVFGLTPGWRLDWGGLLLFHGEMERSAEALAPRFNTLDLFAVPRSHSVSLVTPAAPHRRYAITGWLR
jgi:SM-20-related protein